MSRRRFPIVVLTCFSHDCGATFTAGATNKKDTTKAAQEIGWLCWRTGQNWCAEHADAVRGRRRLPGNAYVPIRVVPGNPSQVKRAAS